MNSVFRQALGRPVAGSGAGTGSDQNGPGRLVFSAAHEQADRSGTWLNSLNRRNGTDRWWAIAGWSVRRMNFGRRQFVRWALNGRRRGRSCPGRQEWNAKQTGVVRIKLFAIVPLCVMNAACATADRNRQDAETVGVRPWVDVAGRTGARYKRADAGARAGTGKIENRRQRSGLLGRRRQTNDAELAGALLRRRRF